MIIILNLREDIIKLMNVAKDLDIEKDSYELSVIHNSISCLFACIDVIENMEKKERI